MRVRAAILALLFVPSVAWAQEDRDYCTDRPGIGMPPCTMAPGKISVELGAGDWTLDKDADQREDTIETGNLLVRYGIADHAEVQIGWDGYDFVRTRDRLTGAVDHQSGAGDVMLGVRRNLANPDGSGFSIAVMPYVTLPVGRDPGGAGDWGAGVHLPFSYEVSDALTLTAASEIDAAVDEDRHGRHFAVSQAVGFGYKLSKAVTASAEYQIAADHDPQGHSVQHVVGADIAWQPRDDLQFDIGANAGLDRDAPDAEVYAGISRRF